jgi:hypothetical protein
MPGPPPPPPPPSLFGGGPPAPPPPMPAFNTSNNDRSDLLKAISDTSGRPKLKKVDPSQIKDRSKPLVAGGSSNNSPNTSANSNTSSSSDTAKS